MNWVLGVRVPCRTRAGRGSTLPCEARNTMRRVGQGIGHIVFRLGVRCRDAQCIVCLAAFFERVACVLRAPRPAQRVDGITAHVDGRAGLSGVSARVVGAPDLAPAFCTLGVTERNPEFRSYSHRGYKSPFSNGTLVRKGA